MSNKAPIDVYTRAKDESELYREAYLIALTKQNWSPEASLLEVGPKASVVAEAAVKDYRDWLVDQGYVDLDECTD